MEICLNELKALIIGVVGYFLSLAIHRYWSNWSVKSLNRRIQQAEAQKLLVEGSCKVRESCSSLRVSKSFLPVLRYEHCICY